MPATGRPPGNGAGKTDVSWSACISRRRATHPSNLERIAEQGYAVFSRSELLEFLNAHKTDNDIYNDFRDRLRENEAKESSFSETPVSRWEADEWKGFYRELEKSRDLVNWGYESWLSAAIEQSQQLDPAR